MKKYILMPVVLISAFSFAQITIGKTDNSSAPANGSVSLEFGNPAGGNKGIVLPWVSSAAAVLTTSPSTVVGTFIFDTADQKVKYRRIVTSPTTATIWEDLSAGALSPVTPNVPDTNPELTTAKTVIGSSTSNPQTDTTPGILVLNDPTKAMILPRVNSYNDIPSPSAGMMVYVTSNNQLAVFNGREWSFWSKP